MIMNLSTERVSAGTAARMAAIIVQKAKTGDNRAQLIVQTATPNPTVGANGKDVKSSVDQIHQRTRFLITKYIEVDGDTDKAVTRLQNELTKAIVYSQFDNKFGLNVKSRANRGPKPGRIKYFKEPVKPGKTGVFEDEEETGGFFDEL